MRILVCIVLTAVVTAACDDGGRPARPSASPPDVTAGARSAATPSGRASETRSQGPSELASAAACESTDQAVEGAITTRARADVDGDGQAEQVYLRGQRWLVAELPDHTAVLDISGARTPSLLGAADADGDGASELFVTPGTLAAEGDAIEVQLVVFLNCRLRFVKNREGQPYTFVVGATAADGRKGAGLGCGDVDGDGRRDLFGVSYTRDGRRYLYRRTVVVLDGAEARNAAEDSGVLTSPADDPAIELLASATCGDDQLDADLGR